MPTENQSTASTIVVFENYGTTNEREVGEFETMEAANQWISETYSIEERNHVDALKKSTDGQLSTEF